MNWTEPSGISFKGSVGSLDSAWHLVLNRHLESDPAGIQCQTSIGSLRERTSDDQGHQENGPRQYMFCLADHIYIHIRPPWFTRVMGVLVYLV